MKKQNLQKRNAFSLVELAIVIIIIGLLIAGVMGGASLIKSATLRAVVSESQNYKVASNSFYTKYNYFIGDYNQAIVTGFIGDGDDQIDVVNTAAGTPVGEVALAIAHLRADGSLDDSLFTDGSYTTPAYDGSTDLSSAGQNIPKGKITNSGWLFMFDEADDTNGDITENAANIEKNYLFFLRSLDVDGAIGSKVLGLLDFSDALAIDAMIDDGTLGTGSVLGVDCADATSSACGLAIDVEFFN